MAMITYPLNDVMYTAEDAELYNCTRTSGVYSGEDFSCTVSGTNNNVTIGEGVGWIRNSRFSGKVFANKAPVTLALDIADAAKPRIDIVAVRFDAATNTTDLVIKKGTAAASPVMPEIVQTESVYELYLYSVYRETAATAITADNVTDLRLDASVCGLMADAVSSVDTSAINAQFTALLEKIKQELLDLEHGAINAYTREETLSPSTKTALGLSENAVPDDAFGKLVEHRWRRRTEESGYVEEFTQTDAEVLRGETVSTKDTISAVVYCGTEYTYDKNDGTFTIPNALQVSCTYNSYDTATTQISGKYFIVGSSTSSVLYFAGGNSNGDFKVSKAQTLSPIQYYINLANATVINYTEVYYENIGEYEYVISPDRHAYPDSGREGIFTYEYLGSPLENAKEAYGMRLHWWKRRTEESGYVISQNIGNAQFAGDGMGQATFLVYDSLSVNVENGQLVLGTMKSITSHYSDADYFIKNMKGKYFCQENSVDYYYCDSNTTAAKNGTTQKLEFSNVAKIDVIRKDTIGEYEYVSSPNRNAYPDSGTEGIFSYQYLAVPFENAREAPKVVTGSYVGTGTYGSANPCSLTFDFAPKFVVLATAKALNTGWGVYNPSPWKICAMDLLTTDYTSRTGFTYSSSTSSANEPSAKKSEDGKTLYWYITSNADAQCNGTNYEYYYYAFG